ncbi:hypothetical protein BDV95DRAFT_605505 [Massariosphaeria phaeospora]|uniref:F-box domain-containing protein n=1 Tax=Massariosphaeria phaeospora TaxID=100035 RepID=A0A7C8MA39_9PLEO|nr:hypothetical protein BDV95DRAFT_605505 [Massariosphaeria phaeospora]
MAPNLPDLPAELLLLIVECEPRPKHEKLAFKALRQTCKAINDKITHSFGCKYFADVTVGLDAIALDKIHGISHSQFVCHVEAVTVNTKALWNCDQLGISADAAVLSLEGVMATLLNGTWANSLGHALPRLPHLKHLYVESPDHYDIGMQNWSRPSLSRIFTTIVKTTFTVALCKVSALETLSISATQYWSMVPVHVSVLGSLAIFMHQLSSLKTLRLNIEVDDDEDTHIEPIHILAHLFQRASTLTDLSLGFSTSDNSAPFFRQLSQTLPPNTLRRLELFHLDTQLKDLKRLLKTCKETLQVLGLHCVTFTGDGQVCRLLRFLREDMVLKEVLLCGLNEERLDDFTYGVHFNLVNLRQWKLHLKMADGDDIGYWLNVVEGGLVFDDLWEWDDVVDLYRADLDARS